MGSGDPGEGSSSFLQVLCRHVRDPLSTAERVVERERTEATAERDAFETFADRLAAIEAASSTTIPGQTATMAGQMAGSGQIERVRTAYRETVMDVPHYDEVYGEPLIENLTAEFGPDIAAGVRVDDRTSFTRPYKTALRTAATRAARERQSLVTTLDRERQSITRAHTDITDLLATVETTPLPERSREDFSDRLDRIARERQETLRARQSLPHLDGHSLCEYLYQREPWTYPVLTAVTRLREAVTT